MLHVVNPANLPAALLHHVLTFDMGVVMFTWVTTLIGAAIVFLRSPYHGLAHNFRNYLRFCFPKVILEHRSCRLDLWYTIASRAVHPFLVTPVIVGNAVVAKWFYDWLVRGFGPVPAHAETLLEYATIIAITILIADFFSFFCHFLEHKVGVLWELHKVHHSTLFLLPISNRRIHPVQEIFDAGAIMVGVGCFIGAASYLLQVPVRDNLVVGLDAYVLANMLSFYHLRHSHIPMSYGKWEKWILSPAQHQLHHSVETRHWDRNFGLLFAIYDRMAGTLVFSEPQGGFRLGLPGNEGRAYDSLVKLYFSPMVGIARRIGRALPGRARPEPVAGAEANPSPPLAASR